MVHTHLDICSGIGGFALAGRRTGFETVQFVEIEPFCQAVLRKNFPNIPIHPDARTFDATQFLGRIGVLTGGFPCQPHSVAGKGKGESDERNIWPELIRIVTECRPAFCLFENVPGIRTSKYTDETGEERRGYIDVALRDLERAGYSAEPFVVGADDIGATHRRKRVWIVAYCNRYASTADRLRETDGIPSEHRQAVCSGLSGRTDTTLAHSNGAGRGEHSGEQSGRGELPSSEHRGATMADTESAELPRTCHARRGRKRPANGSCKTMADTTGAEQQGDQCGVCAANSGREVDRHAQREACTDLARSGNEDVDDTDELNGRRELRQSDLREQRTRIEREGNGRSLPAFPPARNDFRGWRVVASLEPSLMPCVEREVRDVVDGLSLRLVRRRRNATLKALGNAIVPDNAEVIMRWIHLQLSQR